MARTRQRDGFSLVEIIVAITILGVLAAFAVPRFASLEVEARSAAATALGGTLRSNAALAHAVWLAEGQPEALSLEEQVVAMVNGYPSEASIDELLASFDGFTYDDSDSPSVFSKTDGAGNPIASCGVSYGEAPAVGAAPDIAIEVSGC